MANVLGQIVQYSDTSEEENKIEDKTCETKLDNKGLKGQTVKRTSHEDEKQNKTSQEIKKRRLELPPSLLSMFKDGATDDVKDDPDAHQGRQRSFAHVRGNWATHVYFPIEKDSAMVSMIDELTSLLSASSVWHHMESLHVSVSKTVVVRHHWIDSLRGGLTEALQNLKPFQCELGSVELYTNEEKTRTFLGLRVGAGVDDLKEVVRCVDGAFKEFQLETYYKDPSFHASVAWTLGDWTTKVTDLQREELQRVMRDHLQHNTNLGIVNTDRLEAKCGNKIFSFRLKPER